MFIICAVMAGLLLLGVVSIDFKSVVSVTSSGGILVNKTVTMESELATEIALDPLASGSSATKSISFAGDDLVSIVLVSDKDITWKVNDDGSPDLTVSLLANEPYVWKDDGYITNPLAGVTVTSFKFTNASGASATISGYVQHDPVA